MSNETTTTASETFAPEEPISPVVGHNLPSARGYVKEMRHAAQLFTTNDQAAETHLISVMVCAYRLRLYREESQAHKDEVDGMLYKRKVADTARTPAFTRLLKLAFHADQCDKSRISRCGAALEHAWSKKTPADDLHAFIVAEGGIVKCSEKAKGAAQPDDAQPPVVPIPCDLDFDLKGHASVAGTLKQIDGKWQFVPSKVVSPVRERGRAKTGEAGSQQSVGNPATA